MLNFFLMMSLLSLDFKLFQEEDDLSVMEDVIIG